MINLPPVPVLEVLPQLKHAFAASGAAVLSAPTASGKTTVLPLALLDMPQLAERKIIITEPRRLAAGAAARRLAALLGETPGKSVGCRSRFDNIPGSRIEVVTDGVLLRMLQHDPELRNVGMIIFDEFHERSLISDLTFTLVLDMRTALRPDLLLLPASATGEAAGTAELMGGVPVIEATGKSFPVTLRYRADDIKRPLVNSVRDAILWSLENDEGDILVFLPGEWEIKSVAESLSQTGVPAEVAVHSLFGRLDKNAQETAILPSPAGCRKVVLATNVAESSLTIMGIRVVIDSGLERTMRYDPGRDMATLTTSFISKSSAEQRAGRAGRTAPGVCTRLWSREFHNSLACNRKAEILDTDLAGMLLETAIWGVSDPLQLQWLTPPPAGALAAARSKLIRIGALDGATGNLTARGRELAGFGTEPGIAEILRRGKGDPTAACLAAVLSEENRGSVDFAERYAAAPGRIKELARRFAERSGVQTKILAPNEYRAGELAVSADIYRLVRRRSSKTDEKRFVSFNGSGFFFREDIPLAHCEYAAVLSSAGAGADSEILLAAPVAPEFVAEKLQKHIVEEKEIFFRDGRIHTASVRKLGAIELNRTPGARCTPEEARDCLCREITASGSLQLLGMDSTAERHLERARFIAASGVIPADSFNEDVLAASANEWLRDFIRSDSFADCDITGAITARLAALGCYDPGKAAPVYYQFPSGRKEKIDYSTTPPTLSARLQEFFAVKGHPVIGNPPVRLRIELLSPARRPVQVTSDLPGFWCGSYALVRKEMKAAYPKHDWPETPQQE